MKDRLIGYVIAIVTAVVNYWVFYLIAALCGSTIPHFIAGALTVALVVHELGHLAAFEANGIPARMVFLVLFGGASPVTKKYTSKFNNLTWERQAIIMLAGVAGNMVVILGSYFLFQWNHITHNEFLRIINLNGILILWNLFPLWIFDGGRFAKLLFNSISENRDTKFEIGLTVAFVCMLIVLLIICGRFDFINIWLFAWGLHYHATHDDIHGSESPKAIPEARQKWWAIVFLVMISAGAVFTAVTPVWFLNPKV